MISVQDKIDEIIRNKEAEEIIEQIAKETNSQIEEQILIGQIMRQSQNDISEYVEELKKQKTYELSQKELEYKNSLYYYNYLNLLKSIDATLIELYNSLLSQYYYNSLSFPDPFVAKHISSALIQNIGFPLPEMFYNELLEIIKNKVNSFPIHPDLEFEVELKPIHYAKVGSVYRNYDAYMLNIQLKEKSKNLVFTNH